MAPVTLGELRRLESYEEFAERFPWAVRSDFGGPHVTTEEDWREGVRRLERYDAELSAVRRHRSLGPADNPLLDLVRILSAPLPRQDGPEPDPGVETGEGVGWTLPVGLYQMLNATERRRELSALFAWAVPGDAALEVLAANAPLVECGAGTGYWAAILQQRGADVVAYDLAPPGTVTTNRFHGAVSPWTRVESSASVAAVRRHPRRVLFLCWPPIEDDDASYGTLRAYRGDTLLYVGEGGVGATGTVRFQRELSLNWTLVQEVGLPRWPWLDDRLMVYRRNKSRRPLLERDRCFQCRRFMPTGSIGRCDWCFERDPPAVALRAPIPGNVAHRLEYPEEMVAAMPPALRRALEESPNRIR